MPLTLSLLPGTEEVGLTFETTKSTSPQKQADAIVKTLQELQKLHVTEQNAQRASLFHKLVTELRGLNNEAVESLLPKLVEVSRYFFNDGSLVSHMPYTPMAVLTLGQTQHHRDHWNIDPASQLVGQFIFAG